MNFDINHLNGIQLDVLKEIGNIGAGNAATSFAKILNKKINMDVPEVKIVEFHDLEKAIGDADTNVFGIYLEFYGDISGIIMFIIEEESALHLLSLIMGDKNNSTEIEIDELESSALKEVGNILAGAYLGSLSLLTKLTVKHSVPDIAYDMAGAIFSVPMIEFGQIGDNALFIETDFFDGHDRLKGNLFLIPYGESYSVILDSLGAVS